jgi:hypothetical protein
MKYDNPIIINPEAAVMIAPVLKFSIDNSLFITVYSFGKTNIKKNKALTRPYSNHLDHSG